MIRLHLSLCLTIAATPALVFWVAVDEYEALWAGIAALVVLVGGWFAVPLLSLRRDDD